MRTTRVYWLGALVAAGFALSGCGQSNTASTESAAPQQQAATDWYNQHQGNLPEGLRPEDRLTPDQESRLKVGVVMDNDIRDKVRPAPQDLSDRLPAPPADHRYVAVGGKVGLIDKNYQVKAVIPLHDK